MTLNELVKLIYGRVLTDNVDLDVEVEGACAADLMSDVLASIQPNAVLLTGLCNPQVVRTAQMADVAAIIFVRGKVPTQDIIDLANDEQIPLITAPYGMFELCGRLYKAGLPSLEMRVMRTLDDAADA
jgi:predicted transcriptional regulator